MAGARARERGFTLIEVMVGIALLSFGVLGTISLIDGASGATSSNKAREGATSLSRELLELTRSVEYDSLTDAAIPTQLQARSAIADSSPAAGYTIARRGYVYTVEVAACSLDDPKDGQGAHDVAVSFCADSAPAGTRDRNADDYRRVTISLTWDRRGRTERARQTTVVTNPVGGLGPSVTDLKLSTLTSPITTNESSAAFDVKLTTTPATVSWSIDGDVKGQASGSGTNWTFSWPLSSWVDGSYIVQAQGFDDEGRSGVARKLTVVLNRNAPNAPAGFDAGRNGNGGHVDLEWHSNSEGDIVGYRVYRTDSSGTSIERACPPAGDGSNAYVTGTSCVHEDAPATGTLYYTVVALDVAPGGAVREGAATSPKQVTDGNTVPSSPADLAVCAGGSPGCTLADGSSAPTGTTVVSWSAASDPDSGDSVSSYRVYRDGTGYSSRYGRAYSTGSGTLKFVDTAPGSGTHAYRVTAVDTKLGESAQAGPVTG